MNVNERKITEPWSMGRSRNAVADFVIGNILFLNYFECIFQKCHEEVILRYRTQRTIVCNHLLIEHNKHQRDESKV